MSLWWVALHLLAQTSDVTPGVPDGAMVEAPHAQQPSAAEPVPAPDEISDAATITDVFLSAGAGTLGSACLMGLTGIGGAMAASCFALSLEFVAPAALGTLVAIAIGIGFGVGALAGAMLIPLPFAACVWLAAMALTDGQAAPHMAIGAGVGVLIAVGGALASGLAAGTAYGRPGEPVLMLSAAGAGAALAIPLGLAGAAVGWWAQQTLAKRAMEADVH
jgi:hypothetical protein